MNYVSVALRDARTLFHILYTFTVTIAPLLLGGLVVIAAEKSWELPTRKGGKL